MELAKEEGDVLRVPPDQLNVITQLASGGLTEMGRQEVSAWRYRLGIQVRHVPASVKTYTSPPVS